MKVFFLKAIEVYQNYISIFFPPCCRYIPSCSQYTKDAIYEYGVVKGSCMGVLRIFRCNPFYEGGIEEVPPKK